MIENTGGSGTLTMPTSSLPTKGRPPKEFKDRSSGTLTMPTSSLPVKGRPPKEFKDDNNVTLKSLTPSYSHSTSASSADGSTMITELFTNALSAVQDIVKIFLPDLKGNKGNNVNPNSDILNNDNLSNDWDLPGKIAKGEQNLPPNSLK